MIFAGILSFFVGVAQAFLLKRTLFYILGADYMKAAVYFLLKTVLYVLAAVVLVFWLKSYWFASAAGYILGLPVTAAAYFAYIAFHEEKNSGGDENENADDP